MPDIATIGAALGSIKTASEIAKLIKDSGSSLEEADIKLQIAEIQEELISKDKIIKELEDTINIKANVVYESPYYFTEENEQRDGPFCQQCYDANDKLIRLQFSGNGVWRCQTCDKAVRDSSHVKRERNTPPKGSRF